MAAVPLPDPDASDAVDRLLGSAARSTARAAGHDRTVLRDLAVPDGHRLDERTAAAVRVRLSAAAAPFERSLRIGAAARLGAMQAVATAQRLLDDSVPLAPMLMTLAAEGDAAVLVELLAVVRLELLAQQLPFGASAGADRRSLLVRLIDCPEPEIARAASALMTAQNREAPSAPPPLPAAMRTQIVWWIAALLGGRLGDDPRIDHALVEAADETLYAAPELGSAADAAMHLAMLVRARPDELAALLLEALGDRQLLLFIALLAQASGWDFEATRAVVVDVDGDRLWLLLRAQDSDRITIARIGVALADSDPRRDLGRFAAALDAAMAVTPERAAAVFADATLPWPYRTARAAVAALA